MLAHAGQKHPEWGSENPTFVPRVAIELARRESALLAP